jgi:hypothetical protein
LLLPSQLRLLCMQQRAPHVPGDAGSMSVPRERTELEEIELLSELMILANNVANTADATAPVGEIDRALGVSHDLISRNAC